MVADALDAPPRSVAPLEQTLERVRAVNPYLQAHLGAHESRGGWPLLALLDRERSVLDEHLAIMADMYQTSDRDVLVRFYFGGFVYALASATVGSFMVDQRVPVVEVDSLGVTVSSWGAPDAIILPQPHFSCLPDDPAADHGDAFPVADRQALRSLVHESIIRVCEPLIAALRQRGRVGARALWIAAAETCAGVLIDALPPDMAEPLARAEVHALIGDPASALRAKPEVITMTVGGRRGWGLLGDDCCCNFKLVGERYCDTCPHRPREERLEALHAWLAGRAAGEASA